MRLETRRKAMGVDVNEVQEQDRAFARRCVAACCMLAIVTAMFIWQWLAVMEDVHSESEQL